MKSQRFSWRGRIAKLAHLYIRPLALRLATPLIWVKRRLRPHRSEFETLSGKIRGGEGSLQVLCGIKAEIRHHVLGLIFETPPVPQKIGLQKVLNVFRNPLQFAPAADLALVPATEGQHAWMDDGTWFSIPEWLNGHINLPLSEKVLRHNSLKTAARLIRRHGYEYVVTRDEKSFKDFYHRMHRPYITKIYGDGACEDSVAENRAGCEEFDLLFLQKKAAPGEHLAGMFIVYEPAAPRLWSVGVRDADRQLVRDGVLSGLYLFSFEFLAGRGYDRVFMGGSRPFLDNGVLVFKCRYSQRITSARWEGFGLKILKLTPAVKSCLIQNPFVFRSHGKIYGAVFAQSPLTTEQVAELHHRFWYDGLERLIIWVFDAGNTPPPTLPPELAARTEVRSGDQLTSDNLDLP